MVDLNVDVREVIMAHYVMLTSMIARISHVSTKESVKTWLMITTVYVCLGEFLYNSVKADQYLLIIQSL